MAKAIEARYNGKCGSCGATVTAGDWIEYESRKITKCQACGVKTPRTFVAHGPNAWKVDPGQTVGQARRHWVLGIAGAMLQIDEMAANGASEKVAAWRKRDLVDALDNAKSNRIGYTDADIAAARKIRARELASIARNRLEEAEFDGNATEAEKARKALAFYESQV